MIAGPEVARVISEFESSLQFSRTKDNTHHHEQNNSTQKKFIRDVRALTSVIEELGNPFEEESTDLLVLDTKEILHSAAVETVRNIREIGRNQYHLFVKERLVDKSKSLKDPIKRKKLQLFSTKTKTTVKSKQDLVFAKNDSELFSRLYIACQTRDGDLDEFFRHENRAYPPALSQDGRLRFGTKADLLGSLEQLVESRHDEPQTTSVILDGAVIVQMLKPNHSKTFMEYAKNEFIPYILSQLQHQSRLDLVWDCYVKTGSLKTAARAKRGRGTRRRVTAFTTIPGN